MKFLDNKRKAWLTIAITTTCLLSMPLANAAMDESKGGGKHDKHGGKSDGGGGHGGHGKSHGNEPGSLMEMCHDHEGMPPHYCEPIYKVASSAKGVRIEAVEVAGDQELMVTLDEINSMAPGVNQNLVVVGGGGDLAGSMVVKSGWKNSNTVHLKLSGDGTLYDQKKIHLHVFPLTSQ